MNTAQEVATHRDPWNKGKLVGQKAPLRLRDIWAIRIRIQLAGSTRALALFNLAIDSKLRACDLVALRVRANTLALHGHTPLHLLCPTGFCLRQRPWHRAKTA